MTDVGDAGIVALPVTQSVSPPRRLTVPRSPGANYVTEPGDDLLDWLEKMGI